MPNSNANVRNAVPIALEDDEPELGLSASNLDQLTTFRSATALNPDSGLVKLIDDAIAENSGSNTPKSPVANPSNGTSGNSGSNTRNIPVVSPSNDTSVKPVEDSSKIAEVNVVPEEGANKRTNTTDNSSSDGKTIEGSDDDDLIVATGVNQTIFGKKGKDKIKVKGGKNKIYGGKDDDDCEGGDDDDEIRGDRGKDKIHGGKGNDKIDGGKDDDIIFGGSGKDTCKGDDGDDWVHGNDGDDDVDGGAGSDTVYGGKGDDKCEGGEGNDTVRGDRGNDNVSGGDGNDNVNGGKDNDTVIGGAGSDVCMGDDGDDSVMGGDGDDTLMGGAGKDTLVAGDGNDMVDGGDGDDSVVGGGSGNDTLMGGSGNDTIVGGTGNHTCTGGAGDDVFVIGDRNSGPNSVITDYTDNDKLLLSGSLSFSSLSFVQVGLNTEIRGSSSFVLALLLNVNASILKAGNFLGATGGTISTPTPTPTPVAAPRPINTPPRGEANNILIASSSGTQTTITSDLLRFVGGQQGASGTVFKLTELPDTKTGQLFFKGVAVTQIGFSFTQADINAGSLTFQAAAGFIGAATFGFDVNQGTNVIVGQRFSLKIEQNVFKFPGNTTPQVIVGSATLDNDIEGGDGDDDIKGGSGKDIIKGGKGKDKIKGGDGDNDIDGGDDDDDIEGGKGKDKIIGGKGKDKIKGGDGDNDIDGGDDDDDIEVGKGKNKIKGGLGNDKIKGGDDDDSIEGGAGTNTLTGGAGKDRFIYKTSRQEITTVAEADLITDFNVEDDVLEFSNAAFALSVTSLTRLSITATSAVGSIGSSNLLDFSADITVTSIATLQARFAALGGNIDTPTFCQFTDAATGRSVLVFAVGARFEIVASFSVKISLEVRNFVFTGPALNIPVGTVGPDNINFGTYPAAVNFDGLGGDDNIVGSNFNDSIKGGDGNDTLTGGLGLDVLSGGSGADLFVYATTKEGGDKITDFTFGVDKFQFAASEFGNLTTTNFDGVTGSTPDITGKELVIFTGGTYATVEAAQAKALGNSTTAGFFAYSNASNETVLVFDSNGTATGGSPIIANLGTAAGNLGTSDFVFTGTITSAPIATSPSSSGSVADLTAAGNTFPVAFNNFGSGAGGYNFSTPVLFTGNGGGNSVTGTQFADIINGGSGADIFDGGAGNDSLFGGGGSDTINGGAGNDTLIGGLGTNVLNGGAGADVFVFSGTAAGGGDLITSYSIVDDVINLDKTGFAAFTSGAGALGSSFYKYSSTVTVVTALEATLTGPSIMAIYDGLSTKLYYDSNGSTVGGSSLFATVDVNLGVSGNTELFLF
ncbi:calcium-binding protein [filamentous cyanobacterium Phorm 6]|nr:calcium-binding protein [filamentous cyanobacterium Phorm 6]